MAASGNTWVLASGNHGKLRELEELLKNFGLTIVPQSRFDLSTPPETAHSFVENALLKARYASAATSLPAIADDSGLLVDALDGAPGIRSARFAGPNASADDNVELLLQRLEGLPIEQRGGHFYCVIVALLSSDDPAPLIATGEWRGLIATAPAGQGGFGYDPVFFDPQLGATAAELPAEVKNSRSHRYQALSQLHDSLAQRA